MSLYGIGMGIMAAGRRRFGRPKNPPHRYWQLVVTAAMTDATGVVAVNNLVAAETAGGPHALAAVAPTANRTNGGFVASNVQDATVYTNFVSTAGTFPVTLTWDLGADAANWKNINEVRLAVDPAWHPQAPKTFTFRYSDDGVEWTDRIVIASEVGWNGSAVDGWASRIFQAPGCPDKIEGYLWYRLNISAGNDGVQCALSEIELRDAIGGADRTVPGSPVICSQQTQAAKNTLDGSASTGWFGTTGFPYTIGAELAERIVLAQLSLMPFDQALQGYAPKNWTIEGSNDRQTWDVVATITDQTAWAANPTTRLFNV